MGKCNSRTPVATRTCDWWWKRKQIHGRFAPAIGLMDFSDEFRTCEERSRRGERKGRSNLSSDSQSRRIAPFRGTNSYRPILGTADYFSRRGRCASCRLWNTARNLLSLARDRADCPKGSGTICPNLALGVDSRKFVATTRKFSRRPARGIAIYVWRATKGIPLMRKVMFRRSS